MSPSHTLILILLALTALNWTIHWYTQRVTYRLFPLLAEKMKGEDFVVYHRAYQRQLVWAVYLPWTFLMLASIGVLIALPQDTPALRWVLFGLNAAIAVISIGFAAPIHSAIDKRGAMEPADASGLLRANGVRLIIASASLFVCAWFTFNTLAAA